MESTFGYRVIPSQRYDPRCTWNSSLSHAAWSFATLSYALMGPGGPITSIAAELRELASLHAAGILTDDEFNEQKQRLLPH